MVMGHMIEADKSDAARAVTFSKRKKGLLKKVTELSILCGVDVAVMCHPPVGAPLTWGHPDLHSVLTRFHNAAPEERAKRKLDNTSLLHAQLQKLTADLHHLVDQNRKLADHLENSLWDDRLNSYGLADLQAVATQVLCKKKEVADRLAQIHGAQPAWETLLQQQLAPQTQSGVRGNCWRLADGPAPLEPYQQQFIYQSPDQVLPVFDLMGSQDEMTTPQTNVYLPQLMSSMTFQGTHEIAAAAATLTLQSTYMHPILPSIPLEIRPSDFTTKCLVSPEAIAAAESANSKVSGQNQFLDPETPTSTLAPPDQVWAMNPIQPLDYGSLDIIPASDMASAWYNPATSSDAAAASDAEGAKTGYASQKQHMASAFLNDMVNCGPVTSGPLQQLGGCQSSHINLQPELGIFPEHIT